MRGSSYIQFHPELAYINAAYINLDITKSADGYEHGLQDIVQHQKEHDGEKGGGVEPTHATNKSGGAHTLKGG